MNMDCSAGLSPDPTGDMDERTTTSSRKVADDAREYHALYRQRFSVHFDFPVYFTRGIFRPHNLSLLSAIRQREPSRQHRLLVLIDKGVSDQTPGLAADIQHYAETHGEHLQLATSPVTVAGGEACKNDPQLIDELLALIQKHAIDRHSFVLVIGGGALLDAAGYAAAIAHRGVRLIRIPTTVLSQDDSGIGIKNGVNAFSNKNYLGTFVPPFAVINDIEFLRTLEPRDKIAGMAEAVKVALIRDPAFFDWIEGQTQALAAFDEAAMETLIRDCATLHMQHIANCGDPFEMGSARPLDFGHWAAHKLECLTDYDLRHGEAVAIGIALDSRYSVETGLLSEDAQMRIQQALKNLGFRLWHEKMDARDQDGRLSLLQGLSEFREHLGGRLTVTLLTDIGHGLEVHDIDTPAMTRSIAWLKNQDMD